MDMMPVTSSQISAVGYDARRRVLGIKFTRGGHYEYDDVPEVVYRGLLAADRDPQQSVGTAFHTAVELPAYAFRRLDKAEG